MKSPEGAMVSVEMLSKMDLSKVEPLQLKQPKAVTRLRSKIYAE